MTEKQKTCLTEEQKNKKILSKVECPDERCANEIIANTELTLLEQILKETKDVKPSLVRKYIEEQLYHPYFKKRKSK